MKLGNEKESEKYSIIQKVNCKGNAVIKRYLNENKEHLNGEIWFIM
jgi:hypothetical protein